MQVTLTNPTGSKSTSQVGPTCPSIITNPQMRAGSLINGSDCAFLLDAYTKSRSLTKGKQLHAYMITTGLFLSLSLSATQTRLSSKLAAMYAISGDPNHARLVFDRTTPKSGFVWNAMIRGYAQNGLSEDALHLFDEMLSSEHRPDSFSFTCSLKACGDLGWLKMGLEIHCQVFTSGFGEDSYVHNSLISMYMSCGAVENARKVFDRMPERTTVSWNTMVSGFVHNGRAEEALEVFDRMRDAGVEVDSATVVSVLPACAQVKDLRRGREIHQLVDEKGFGSRIAVRNSLVDMYAKCGAFEDARNVFEEMGERDVVSWTALIGGFILNGCAVEALRLSHQMQLLGMRPNSLTLAGLLSACASLSSLKHGKCIHGSAVRHGFEYGGVVKTALIDMYAKCGCLDHGYQLVMMGHRRRAAPWNALISGHTWNGQAGEAIVRFIQMKSEEVHPDGATMICLLPAYAKLADLQLAMNIHCYLIRTGFQESAVITTGLIDVYSKSGNLDSARDLFDRLHEKDIASWNAIIAGFGMHGHGRDAIFLFNWMLQTGVKPDLITYTSILYACSHAGLVDEGLHFLNSMVKDYQMKPYVDHYACIVDLLGRAGQLNEAYELIKTMPLESNHAVWGALLSACVIHENVSVGEVVAGHLFALEPDNTGNYVLLANLYAAVGRWKDVEMLRSMMNERGLGKTPGCSTIHAVWGALLDACVIHENVSLGEVAAGHLFALEPDNYGNYVLLANMYAAVGRWKDVEKVKRMMNERVLRNTSGCSTIDARNYAHASLVAI